ncbi:hypothetical protein KC343_g6917 [Hortaea werneckii]|uniref:Uncharacterized protein n=1 Tax=Hortaea werneckii TaxID=91943 RepID=A0A3M7GCP8_HORWE|nr:hypothetical protein KC352_g15074 [Hortaea werneckii]KAI7564267.1 hypothetical protein KC317_g7179 [Hortaea werneckii]KAI7614692.1 hypothetical protein KC346_g6831 [Hortaea werneckii]KAI7624593.1 hypothetical protein KC343_g6917 [Hortaea werneckii]KAI7671079.1 hypothetical protein KC319_g5674 [Hortaea werneckii]
MRLVLPELQDSGYRNRFIALHGPWIALVVVCGVITTIFSVVTTQGTGISSGYRNGLFYCDPRDRVIFTYSEESFDRTSPYWDPTLFLSVTMGFHGLTFPKAKAIDICFDLFIGRGSQVLVALAVYPLLRRAVLRSMEVRDFSLALVLPFFMERLSAFTLWAMSTNMSVTQKKDSSPDARIARSRIRIDWRIVLVVLVGCYILSIPTFLSAMTSYQARGEPFFPVNGDSNYMSADDVKYPNVFVQHGDQLGLGASSGGSSFDFPLYNATDPELYAACVGYYEARFGQVEELWRQNWEPFHRAYPTALKYAYYYAHEPSRLEGARKDELAEAKLAFDKTRNSLPLRQTITDKHKPPSWSFTLWPRNVTWGEDQYLLDNADFMNSAIYVRNTSYDLDTPVALSTNSARPRIPDSDESDTSDGIPLRFKYPPDPDSTTEFAMKDGDTVLYRGFELATKGKCLPFKDYVWGFSALMLFTFCMLTIFILLLLIALHYDAYCNSMADRYKLRISAFRDVLDLADELRAHYGEAEVASMSAPELDKSMQTDPAMIGLGTATLRNPRAARWKQGSLRLRIPQWGKRRKASGVAGSSTSDAEESLMSIGLDKHESGFGLGNMPSKAVTRQST